MRNIEEGDRVGRGAVLVRMRSSEYEDKVRQASSQAAAAEAVATKAKLDFDRATHLYDSQSLTKPDFDAARAQYDSSQEQLKSARAVTSEAEVALRDTSLIAPFDGDIVKKTVELGGFVAFGQDRPARRCCHRRVPHTDISRPSQPDVIGGRCDYPEL
jgi:RND family efflux transporter MFP subunit